MINNYCKQHCKGFKDTGRCYSDDCKMPQVYEQGRVDTTHLLINTNIMQDIISANKEVVYTLYRASDRFTPIRELISPTLNELDTLPERFVKTASYTYNPPYEIIVNTDEHKIMIYDYYVE